MIGKFTKWRNIRMGISFQFALNYLDSPLAAGLVNAIYLDGRLGLLPTTRAGKSMKRRPRPV
jgi:hypothetical protein